LVSVPQIGDIKRKGVPLCIATLPKKYYGKFLEVWNLLSRRFQNPPFPSQTNFPLNYLTRPSPSATLKAVDEAGDIGGADVAADHAVTVDENVGIDGAFIVGVVGNGEGVAGHLTVFVFE